MYEENHNEYLLNIQVEWHLALLKEKKKSMYLFW